MHLRLGLPIFSLLQSLNCAKIGDTVQGLGLRREREASRHEPAVGTKNESHSPSGVDHCTGNFKRKPSMIQKMPQREKEDTKTADEHSRRMREIVQRQAFMEARVALEEAFESESSCKERKDSSNDGDETWSGDGGGRVEKSEDDDNKVEMEQSSSPACRGGLKVSKAVEPQRNCKVQASPNTLSMADIRRHFPDEHYEKLSDLGLPLIASMIERPRSWPLLREWSKEQGVLWENFVNVIRESKGDAKGKYLQRIDDLSRGQIGISTFGNVQTVLAFSQFINLVRHNKRVQLYSVINMKRVFSEETMEVISSMTLNTIYVKIARGHRYSGNCSKVGITREQYKEFRRLETARILEGHVKKNKEDWKKQHKSRDNQDGLPSEKQPQPDPLIHEPISTRELISKWDQMDPKPKGRIIRQLRQHYQGFTNGEAGRGDLFMRVFGALMPCTVVNYFYPYRLKRLYDRFFIVGEMESWYVMVEYLRSKNDSAINSALGELPNSL